VAIALPFKWTPPETLPGTQHSDRLLEERPESRAVDRIDIDKILMALNEHREESATATVSERP